MKRRSRIACIQTRPQGSFSSATAEALALMEAAAANGAKLIALPEYCGGLKADGAKLVPPSAPESRHPVLAELRNFAAANKVWLLIGSLAVDGPADKILNRSFVVDSAGKIRARYDKIHLFDIQLSESEVFRESAFVLPGQQAVIADTVAGRVGMSVCYDLRFPGLYRNMAQSGAELLAVPAAFTKVTGQAHWHILNRARAIENFCFVVSPCAVGPVPGGIETYGHSLIINPWGEVLADGGTEPGVIYAEIDLDDVASARSKIPSLDHDRPYGNPSDSDHKQRQDRKLRDEFLGWQCQIRQESMRIGAGRPNSAMVPEVSVPGNGSPVGSLVTVLSRKPGASMIPELTHILKSTNDPALATENAVRFFAECYYGDAGKFSGSLAAALPSGSERAKKLLEAGNCKLTFENGSKRYELDCRVDALEESDRSRTAAWLHMRLFNHALPSDLCILGFDPEWDC